MLKTSSNEALNEHQDGLDQIPPLETDNGPIPSSKSKDNDVIPPDFRNAQYENKRRMQSNKYKGGH